MTRNLAIVDKRLFFAYVVCSLLAIFYVPYLVKLPPSVSPSYIFGYNNEVGVVLLVLFAGLGALWTKGLSLQFQPEGNSQPVPISTLVGSLVVVLAGCVFMWATVGWVGGYGESGYAIDRILLLAHGKIPYLDFEYAYGASFLYGPVFLQRLLSVSLLHAYYLFWTLNCLLGTALLYAVVNMITYPTRYKKTIFLLMWTAGFVSSVFTMGTSGTYLRFTCPLFFILIVDKTYRRRGSYSKIYATLFAVVFTVLLLYISQETAVAHAFACVCIFLLYSGGVKIRSLGLPAVLTIALALVFWVALKLPMMDTLKAFSGGANSLPITFAPHILLFFALFFVCACYLYRRYVDSRISDNTVCLLAYSLPMLAAALGRCDPYHVLLDEQGVFLACLFYASNNKSSWKWYRGTFVTVPIILAAFSYFWLSVGGMTMIGMSTLRDAGSSLLARKVLAFAGEKYIAAFAGDKRARWETRFAELRESPMPRSIDLESIYPSWRGGFLAPLGYKPNRFETYFSDRIDYGHYDEFMNANTEVAVDRKVAEIRSQPQRALLLPNSFEAYCVVDGRSTKRMIEILNVFPYYRREVNQATVHEPLCDFIVSNYRNVVPPDSSNFDYGLWVRRSSDFSR